MKDPRVLRNGTEICSLTGPNWTKEKFDQMKKDKQLSKEDIKSSISIRDSRGISRLVQISELTWDDDY